MSIAKTLPRAALPAAALLPLLALLLALPLPSRAAPAPVALLLESDADDLGPASLMRKGLAEAAREFGVEATVVVAPPDGDQTAAFREAAKTHGLVLVAEPRLHAVLRDNAGRFRKTSFGCVDTAVRAPNIMSVTFEDGEAAFVAGAAAAILAGPDGGLGWLETESTPMGETMLAAFAAGAQVSRAGAQVTRAETGFGGDAAAALAGLAAGGVRVCALDAGYGTRALLAALPGQPLLGVGVGADLDALVPGKIPLSVVKRFDRAVKELVRRYAEGTFRGREAIVYDLKNGGVDLSLGSSYKKNPGFPQGLERRVSELRREIENGNIRIEDKRIPTLCDCGD